MSSLPSLKGPATQRSTCVSHAVGTLGLLLLALALRHNGVLALLALTLSATNQVRNETKLKLYAFAVSSKQLCVQQHAFVARKS